MFSHNTEHLKFSVVHKSKLLPEFLSVHICKVFGRLLLKGNIGPLHPSLCVPYHV